MSALHKIFSSMFASRPSVHLWQPKSVSLYFKNAVRSKYKLLNLKNYDCVEISIQQEEKNSETLYKLNLITLSGGEKTILTVATFETQDDVEKASLILRNKLFSPGQIFLKISLGIILSLVSVLVIFSLIFGNGNSQNANLAKLEQQKLMEQLLLQEQLQGLSPNNMPQGLDPSMFIAPQGQQMQMPVMPQSYPDPQISQAEAMMRARAEAADIMNKGESERTAAEQMYAPIDTPEPSNSRVDLPQDPKIKGFIDALN